METQDQHPKQKLSIEDMILIILAIGCIGYSTIQTAIGYEAAAGSPAKAWALAGFISAGLALLNYNLRKSYQARLFSKVALIIGLYLFISAFSIAANFNAFYTKYMEKSLYHQDLGGFKDKLVALNQETETAFSKVNSIQMVRQSVEELKVTLELQLLDPAAPGLGRKSRQIISEIELLLNRTLTEPAGSPSEIWNSYRSQIDGILKMQVTNKTLGPDKFLRQLNAEANTVIFMIDSVRGTASLLDDGNVIEQAANTYNTWGEKVEGYINDSTIFKHSTLSNEIFNIGKISYAIDSANKPANKGGAWVALALSFLIDFLVPIMILILTPVKARPKNRHIKNGRQNTFFPTRRNKEDRSSHNPGALIDKVDAN